MFDHFLLSSDAKLLAVCGFVFWLVAALALLMDKRRLKRREINRVGWVPWTGVFLGCAIIGGGILALALPVIVGGGG